jgi:hypothetical protein
VDSSTPVAGPPPPVPGWTLVDYDNFDGTKLSSKRWDTYNSLSTNHVSRWSPSMVSVSGGELRVVGQGRDPSGAGNVSGGLCWCTGGQVYGMWQVRARFENGAGYGQAIIVWPDSNTWPDDGEFDLVETPHADKKSMVQTIHWGTSSDQRLDNKWVNGDFTQWHVYSVIWRPGLVQMLVDDKVYYDSSLSKLHPHIPTNPMHLVIQQEPGPFDPSTWVPAPNSSTPDTVTLHVDWVRLYR